MPTTVQFRRGTTAQNNAFTGAVGEITVDIDKETLIIHDGTTQGGFPLISSADTAPAFISSSADAPTVTLTNTADDATGPKFILQSDRATPADNDVAGTIEFRASDDAGAQVLSASILSKITDVSNGSEDGNIEFAVHAAGSSTTIATVDATGLTVNSGSLGTGTLSLTSASITDSSGSISFGDENLTTTGTITAATGSSIGNLTLANGSITDSSGAISFGDENLTTTGNITGATVTYTTLNDGSNNITATAAEINALDGIASTVTELNIIDGDTAATSTTLADADRVVVNDAGVMKQVALTDFETYFETALDTLNNVTSASSLATVGALNSGSITSGFGSIDVGSSAITTTGTITGGIGVFDNIRIDNTAGEIDTSSGNLTIDSAGGTVTVDDNLSVSGNATVTGNLTVNGTTTTLATTNSVIADTLIELGNGTTGTPLNDAGLVIERGDNNNAFIGFDESADKFIVGTGTFTGASTGDLTITTGTLVANIEGNLTGTIQTASQGNITTVGALNGGSITSGFGAIDNGSSNITTTGTVTYGSLSDGTITITAFVDEDNMATNSATLVPTQQSVKAYVDSAIGSLSSTSISQSNTNVTVADAGSGTVTVTVDGSTNSVFSSSGITLSQGNFVGNASTATTLQTARTIGGVSFNGSANINLPGVNTTGNQNTSGTAAVATTVTLVATNTTNATHYVTFVDAATGNENIRTDTNLTYNPSTNVLGTTASAAQYADLAERYSADQEYEPGTVMSFGGDHEITQSTLSHDPRVAGVVSTAPAYLMNADLENGTALALQGRTPVKVIGRILKGDMLVASQTPGVASALDSSAYTPGCVIGKALESYDSQTVGTIEVVVGRI